jgi:uncharacterized membrane protein
MLVVALLIGLVVWAVLRMTGPNRLAVAGAGWSGPVRRADAALDLVRTRYARGEISRDEFVQISADLGGPPTEPPPPPAPPADEPA